MEHDTFYKYYDILFSSKDYSTETEFVFQVAKQYLQKPVERILEIGCGTGNHTIELAKSKYPITAIDIDKQMIKLCIAKINQLNLNNIEVKDIRVQNMNGRKYSIALSLFNVINYISEFDELVSFFTSINNHLQLGGGIYI